MSDPTVAVVVVNYRTPELTSRAVASVERSKGVDVRVWIVDNGSDDGSVAFLENSSPGARLVSLERNLGFGSGVNAALQEITEPWILILNSDAVLTNERVLHSLVELHRERPGLGVMGPRIEDPDGNTQFSVRTFPSIWAELARGISAHRWLPGEMRSALFGAEFVDYEQSTSADWLTGACFLVRRDVIEDVGGFDPSIFMYGEELEWMWRVNRAGWEVWYHAEPGVQHLGKGSSRGPGEWQRRSAMAGDAYAVRVHRGVAYLAGFALARCLGLTLQWMIQSTMGFLARDETRRRRGREAWLNLKAWIAVLTHKGFEEPRHPAFLPEARPGSV